MGLLGHHCMGGDQNNWISHTAVQHQTICRCNVPQLEGANSGAAVEVAAQKKSVQLENLKHGLPHRDAVISWLVFEGKRPDWVR